LEPVTIVIPTFNRPGKLKQTLDALGSQEFKDFSVIVSDDGSTPENFAANKKLENQYPFSLTILTHPNAGASVATNRGVETAADGLVILLDDDILVSPGSIAAHVQFQEKNPGSIVAGGASTSESAADSDVQRYKVYMENEWKKKRPESTRLLKVSFDSFITTTANTSFRKSVFTKVGGFDPALRDGYDVDFAMRALLADVPVFFDPSITSIHNDPITLQYYAKRQRAYTVSKQRIAEKNPALADSILRNKPAPATGIRKLVYAIARTKVVVSLAESGKLAWILPRSVRYRIYGNVIAALSQ
jgi:GT2 family glycosyltransferase